MAYVSGSIDINTGGAAAGVMKRGFFAYGSPSYDATNRYVHMKTNIIGSYIMSMVEAKGTHYGASRRIHSRWVFYSYSTGSLYNNYYHTIGGADGLVNGGSYLSSDNYVVIWAEMYSTAGDCNFTLNAVHPCPTGSRHDIAITQYATTSATSGAF